MKHIEIEPETHDLVRFYCLAHGLKLKHFVNDKLKNLPEIKAFNKKRQKLKFS